MQIALFEMKKIDQGPGKKVITPSMYVIYSTPIMRSPVTMRPKIVGVDFQFLKYREIILSFLSILCWTKQNYLSKKFWLHKGFDPIVIFSNFMCIGWNFETFFFNYFCQAKLCMLAKALLRKSFGHIFSYLQFGY